MKVSCMVVVHSFNHNTWDTEAGRSLQVQGQPGLQSESQDSQDYTQRNPVSQNKTKSQQNPKKV